LLISDAKTETAKIIYSGKSAKENALVAIVTLKSDMKCEV